MDALVLILASLVLFALGCALHNSYRNFSRRAVPIKGVVSKLVRVENENSSLTFSTPSQSILVPMVTYEYRGKYQFIADEDARMLGICAGDEIHLLIDDEKPRIAHIATEESVKKLPIVMVFTSMVLFGIGISLVDLNDMAKHWQLMALATVILALLSIKLIEQLLPLLAGDVLFENAEETE